MKGTKNIALCLFLALFVVSLFVNVYHSTMREQKLYGDTIRTTFVDTIPYYKIVPKDSTVIRYITQRLPVVEDGEGNFSHKSVQRENEMPNRGNFPLISSNFPNGTVGDCTEWGHINSEDEAGIEIGDSATVRIPITQKVYEDSTYTAYVSGYCASLDSLIQYTQREIVTIKPSAKRWHIGLSAGYGITPRGMQPVVAVTLTFSIFSF